MEALAVNEDRACTERPSGTESHTVAVGVHVFTVAEQFQPASEVVIAGIGDTHLFGAVRRSYRDGARAIELGVQVDRTAGQGQRGTFIHADDRGVIGIDAQRGSRCEGKRAFLHRQMSQGRIRIGQGQRTGARLGQGGSRRIHDAVRQSRPGDSITRTHHGNIQGTSVSHRDAAGNVVTRHVRSIGGIGIGQRATVKGNGAIRPQRVDCTNGQGASIQNGSPRVGIGQIHADIGIAIYGQRRGIRGIRNSPRIVGITDKGVGAAVDDNALGRHIAGDFYFTRLSGGEVDFLIVQRRYVFQLGSPAVSTGIQPLAVRPAVPDKAGVSADILHFQHQAVAFHHHGVFKAFLLDVRCPREGFAGQASGGRPLGEDVVGSFQVSVVVQGKRAIGIRQSQRAGLNIDDRLTGHQPRHVKGQRGAAVQRQAGSSGHSGARAHGDAAQCHGVRVCECQRAAVYRRPSRVGILRGQGQGAGTVFDKAARSGENAAKRNRGAGLVVIRFGRRIILTRINRQFTAKSHVLGGGPAFRRGRTQRSGIHVQIDRICIARGHNATGAEHETPPIQINGNSLFAAVPILSQIQGLSQNHGIPGNVHDGFPVSGRLQGAGNVHDGALINVERRRAVEFITADKAACRQGCIGIQRPVGSRVPHPYQPVFPANVNFPLQHRGTGSGPQVPGARDCIAIRTRRKGQARTGTNLIAYLGQDIRRRTGGAPRQFQRAS